MQRFPAALRFIGGHWGAFLPLLVFLVGVTWLGLSGKPSERGMWPILILALGCGVALCRSRTLYAETVIKGMSQPILAVMILAWMLAGILAALLEAGGLVDILQWAAAHAGLTGAAYCIAAFLVAAAVSTATGTSLGTLALCTPSLYAAGFGVGADPEFLIGAILGGATFGDNISPVSDTTIASTLTQGARMGNVVRTRLRYALPAAAAALIVTGAFHGPQRLALPTATAVTESALPDGLPILIAPILVLALLLRQAHLLAGLLAGIAAAAVIGLGLGLFAFGDLVSLDGGAHPYEAGGLLLKGMDRGIGISIFTLLLMGLVAGLEASGVIQALSHYAEKRIRSARDAEWWSFGIVSLTTMATTHSVVSLLAVGRFVRETGFRHGIPAERRANLLDTTVCTYPFLLPYCIPTVFAATLTTQVAGPGMYPQNAGLVGLHNFHSWALLAVVIVSIATGWGRGSVPTKDSSRSQAPTAPRGDERDPWRRADASRSDLHDLSDIRSLSGAVPRPRVESSPPAEDETPREPTQEFDVQELQQDELERESRALIEESRSGVKRGRPSD